MNLVLAGYLIWGASEDVATKFAVFCEPAVALPSLFCAWDSPIDWGAEHVCVCVCRLCVCVCVCRAGESYVICYGDSSGSRLRNVMQRNALQCRQRRLP